ncbi:hypothetical protein [Aliidiomarina maris]|uniref:Uncharacterized protein n=1 Tax=Aliidiomarina maris TaxID=531312 RepID=A0A327X5F5_9GAMM|nr:hypothetical protein [Aliidiomarina maris]RAK00584.1 hypothetical protein B0I24_1029 [Aliidiomarina maris]RUO27403.1 hypothetical protein CWE07_05530 [Aliidiomarina maris]
MQLVLQRLGITLSLISAVLTPWLLIQQSGSLASIMLYLTCLWATSPYVYLSMQNLSARNLNQRISGFCMALSTVLLGVYFTLQAAQSGRVTEQNLVWLFGPLVQWLVMFMVSMATAIVLMKFKRRRKF